MDPSRRTVRERRLLLIVTLGAGAGVVLLANATVSSKWLKLALLVCLLAAWAGLLLLGWRRKGWRYALLALPILAAVPFLLPGQPIDRDELRRDYVQRMLALEGTAYFWGGESSRGIDCSGLPRRAYRDALLACGFRHGNGRAFRAFAEQWWYDASARALREGYRGMTAATGIQGTIRTMDPALLEPGDFAVTNDGVHVVVYAGGERWIQADPGAGKVETLPAKTGGSLYFDAPVTVFRWWLLQSP